MMPRGATTKKNPAGWTGADDHPRGEEDRGDRYERSGLLAAAPPKPGHRHRGVPAAVPPLREYCAAYASLLYYHCPCLCTCAIGLVALAACLALINYTLNPLEEFGRVSPSFSAFVLSAINGKADLQTQLRKVDRWCLGSTSPRRSGRKTRGEECPCEDPLTPLPGHLQDAGWQEAFRKNKWQTDQHSATVAFLGGRDRRGPRRSLARVVEAVTRNRPDRHRLHQVPRESQSARRRPRNRRCVFSKGERICSRRVVMSFLTPFIFNLINKFFFLRLRENNNNNKTQATRPRTSSGGSSTGRCRPVSIRRCGGSSWG